MLALSASSCVFAPKQPTFTDADYPGVLREPETLKHDILLRQRVTALWGDGESRGFDAVIQKQAATLTVLGLSETGSMGFAIVLTNGEIELTNEMPFEFPFPPRHVMLDVQRTFYPWLAQENRADGIHESVVEKELVSETWLAGKLIERRFSRIDAMPEGVITVRYEWNESDWSVPTFARLDNGWFGYMLEIDTHAETLLGEVSESQ